jgi:autotransporter translocation and assembly factor TamB
MLNGQVSLAGGAADLPQAGLQLRNIELRAASDPARPGAMLLRGGLASGPGRVDLTGRLDLPDMELALELKGERLQIYNTPDGRALASPDLQISWSDEVLRLRGRVLIPEAAITPRLALNPGMASGGPAAEPSPGQLITPSPDVVVLEEADGTERAAQLASTFRVDSEVELVLGDEVPVNALGFISRITGGATFTNDPRQADLIPSARGRLSFDEGTFRAFGQDLEIETGQIIFPGGPVNEPDLVVRAVRWIDNDPQVTAVGVMVAGPIDNPVVELFSRPQLEPSEIQSYLLTGRSSGTRDDVLSIGTYLHPRFYAGYGYNLLEKTSEFNGLFTITPRYGVGAGVGEADNNVHLTFTHEH